MENQFHRWLLALLAWPLLPLCGMACDCPYYGAPCKAFANMPDRQLALGLKPPRIGTGVPNSPIISTGTGSPFQK
jgi:hypothetical protein